MGIVVEALCVFGAGIGGGALGAAVCSRARFSYVAHPEVAHQPSLDEMEPLIRDTADRWAQAHERPEAAALVAEKLRTMYRLRYAPRSRRRDRFSR